MARWTVRGLRTTWIARRAFSHRNYAAVDSLEQRRLLAADVVISEFMASNSRTLQDMDGDHPDWIELHNTTHSSVNLSGWHLTDDPDEKTKWTFPSTPLAADGYLVVFASDKDRRIPGQQLHTNFQLSADGEYLALVMPDGVTVASEF